MSKLGLSVKVSIAEVWNAYQPAGGALTYEELVRRLKRQPAVAERFPKDDHDPYRQEVPGPWWKRPWNYILLRKQLKDLKLLA